MSCEFGARLEANRDVEADRTPAHQRDPCFARFARASARSGFGYRLQMEKRYEEVLLSEQAQEQDALAQTAGDPAFHRGGCTREQGAFIDQTG